MIHWIKKILGLLSVEEECAAVKEIVKAKKTTAPNAFAVYAVTAGLAGYDKAMHSFIDKLVEERIQCLGRERSLNIRTNQK